MYRPYGHRIPDNKLALISTRFQRFTSGFKELTPPATLLIHVADVTTANAPDEREFFNTRRPGLQQNALLITPALCTFNQLWKTGYSRAVAFDPAGLTSDPTGRCRQLPPSLLGRDGTGQFQRGNMDEPASASTSRMKIENFQVSNFTDMCPVWQVLDGTHAGHAAALIRLPRR